MIDLREIYQADRMCRCDRKGIETPANHLELIASENFVSLPISCYNHLTNKYAEGYPGRRYCSGCEYVDIRKHCHRRARKIYQAEHANVQPHSTHRQIWRCIFSTETGDTIMGMNLDHGGHLNTAALSIFPVPHRSCLMASTLIRIY